MSKEPCERRRGQEKVAGQDSEMGAGPCFLQKIFSFLRIPVIPVHQFR